MTDKLLANCEHNYGIWKMQDWKMTDKILTNSGQNYGVWKMQEYKTLRFLAKLSVIFQSCIFRSCIFSRPSAVTEVLQMTQL